MFEAVYSESSGSLVRDFWAGKKCPAFVGVCLNHRMSSISFLQKFIPWVAEHSDPLLILVCDYLERHNEMAFNHLSESDAVERVMLQGEKIQKITDDAFVSCGLSGKVDCRVMNFRGAVEDPSFRQYYELVNSAYDNNEAFREDVLMETNGFVRRIALTKPKRYSYHEPNHDPDWLRVYLLEEIAMYVNLFFKGYTVEVYPGADSLILKNIAEGKYGIFPEYENRTHISVMDKGREV